MPLRAGLSRLRLARSLLAFMPLTLVAALLVVAVVGWLGPTLADPRAHGAAIEQYAESLVERDLAERGWVSVGARSAAALGPPPAAGAPGAPSASRAPEGDPAIDLARAAAELSRVHRLALLVPTRDFALDLLPGPVTGAAPEGARATAAAAIVAAELARFPPGSLAGARFRRVLVCARLAEAGASIPSLPNYQRTMLLDVGSSPEFLRRLVHHELYHFIDYADDDQVLLDPGWEALNDRHFLYGSGGRAMRDPGSSRLLTDRPGFVSLYATSALEEDKAEVFSFLMTAPRAMRELAARDAVLRRKIAAVERQVAALLPALDARFFRAVARGER